MRINQVFVFFLFFVSPSVVCAQYTDLKEYGLQGKVKTMSRYQYRLLEKNAPVDSSRWSSKITTYFNINGGIDSIFTCTNLKNSWPPIDEEINYSRTVYYFDTEGRRKGGYYISNLQLNIKNILQIEWIPPSQYVETTYATDPRELVSTSTTFLNHFYRDSAGTTLYYHQDSLIFSYRFVCSFNARQELVEFVESDLTAHTVDSIQVEVKTKDAYHNPTAYIFVKKGAPYASTLYIRQYEYYRD